MGKLVNNELARKNRMELHYHELEKRIDEVLYYVWDPIGVSDEPCARNEYRTYVQGVLRQVIENDQPTPISDYLSKIVADSIGLPSNKEHDDHTAKLLLRYKKAILDGLG